MSEQNYISISRETFENFGPFTQKLLVRNRMVPENYVVNCVLKM